MNIYPEKLRKPNLTEVIYSTMDGNVYFLDLKTGERTRDDITVGLPFKGAGALHPSMPLLFLGPGDSGPGEELYARAFIYSLTNGEKLFEYGGKDPFAPRVFHGFDSSALVHKQTDTLIQPGENGILYTMKLNTQMTPSGVTIDPSEILKLRYTTNRSSEEKYWLGMEDSSVCWKNYIYIADNGGNLLCIDINTMEVIWAQDVVDDTNGSPVLQHRKRHSVHLYRHFAALVCKPLPQTRRRSDFQNKCTNGQIRLETHIPLQTLSPAYPAGFRPHALWAREM